MRHLQPGQEVLLASVAGSIDGLVIAAAGHHVLIKPLGRGDVSHPVEWPAASLTYLEGLIPTTYDGSLHSASHAGELRFSVPETGSGVERRSAVRVPLMAKIAVSAPNGVRFDGQLLDLSAGGVRLRHPGRLDRGVPVRVRVEVPGLTIDADAVTHRVEPGGTSMIFTAFHAGSAQEIGLWAVQLLRAHVSRSA